MRHLVEADALLDTAVEIVVAWQLQLIARFEKGLVERVGAHLVDDIERAVPAVQRPPEALVALRTLEVGEHLGKRPALGALSRPIVVVAGVAADIDHGIDTGRSAQHASARLITPAAVQARLRRRLECPVAPFAGNEDGGGERHAA